MMRKLLVACVVWGLSCYAFAGSISFQLSLTGTSLTLFAKGDSSAFYPAVYRMLADGRWERLALAVGASPVAELLPAAHIDFIWPESRPLASLAPLEQLRPLMVRFFDQAGVSFGQISFMHPPRPAGDTLAARYVDGQLEVMPPPTDAIRATWIIWPQEEGIDSIRKAVSYDHVQPAARRVEWIKGAAPVRLLTGAGQPMLLLLHETAQGLVLQTAGSGVVQGRQQRTAWLDGRNVFYGEALLALALALILPFAWRRKAST